jgi:biopolymer transport protein TolR
MGFSVNNQVGGGMGNKSSRPMMSEINVTPFVDVMLVLLVIFMVTAPLLTAGVQVDLPDEESQPLPGQDEPLSISIDKKGNIFIQEKKTTMEELLPKLDAITKRKKDTRIFIHGDRNIDYGRIMHVMGAISNAGFTKIGLVTEQSDDRR